MNGKTPSIAEQWHNTFDMSDAAPIRKLNGELMPAPDRVKAAAQAGPSLAQPWERVFAPAAPVLPWYDLAR